MPDAAEAQLDAVVDEALALQALADAEVDQRVDGALLQHARAHALLDVFAAAVLEQHAVDGLAAQQLGEDEAGRAGADDAHLRPHRSS